MSVLIRFKLLALAALIPFCALANPSATRDALDALFSTQMALPEGVDEATPPPGFAGVEASEAQLIGYLARQRQRGADLNAYRHKGTPLHHAIRSGMQQTAAWLLKNGANPLLRVQDGAPAADGLDALAVAIVVGNWKAAAMLLQLPVYRAMLAPEVAPLSTQYWRYWPLALRQDGRAQGRSEGPGAQLVASGLPLPGFQQAPVIANALFLHSLCTGQTRFAKTQLDAEPLARPLPSRRAAAVCESMGLANLPGAQAQPLAVKEWLALEKHLQWPVLPYALGLVHTELQWQELLGAGLQLPWSNRVFTHQVVATALQAGVHATPVVRAVPAAALKAALQDDGLFRAWLRSSADWPLPDLELALDAVAPERLRSQMGHLISAWGASPSAGRYAKATEDRLARWTVLTRHLRAPLPAAEDGLLFFTLPPALWPEWFALGFRAPDRAWSGWLAAVDLAQLQQLWPLLTRHQVPVTQRGLAWLVAPLSVGPVDDPQSRLDSYTGYADLRPDVLAKAQFLHAQGLQVPQPRWLAAAFALGAGDVTFTEFAIGKGWVKRHVPITPKQVQFAPVRCRLVATAALRRALTSPAIGTDAAQDIQIIQPVPRAGDADCTWLVSGGESGGRRIFEEEDFFSGVQRLTPCADGNVTAAVWHQGRGVWMPVNGAPEGELLLIDAPAAPRAIRPSATLVSLEAQQGGCGTRTGAVHEAHFANDGALRLTTLGPGDAAFDALALQCRLDALSECFSGAEQGAERSADAVQALQVHDFADKFWGTEKTSFLLALDRMDRQALSAAREAGLFGHWLAEAFSRVSASSSWSVPEKRQRLAWLLAQRRLLPVLSPATLEALLPWLPAQDWGPIIESMRCANPALLKELSRTAGERKLGALGQRLRAALDLPCNAR